MLDTIIATVGRFRGAAKQSDDMTMMLVRRDERSVRRAGEGSTQT